MRCKVYRNLDRPFSLFGIKGRYIIVAGAAAIADIIVAMVVGVVFGSITGIAAAAALVAVGYIAIGEIQQKFGTKSIDRKIAGLSIPKHIIMKYKVWKK
ncbi:MAG: DUF4133 domain-containing protein [Bacteroidales bacterium]|nr:DUF4133 domain-containing protein [Bacteroidales bacterium]